MKSPFSFSWGKPKVVTAPPKYQEIPPGDTLTQLNSYSESVLNLLRKSQGASANYDGAAVKRLSDDINAARSQYGVDAKIKIANLYGCFLGTSIIKSYPDFQGRWVQSDEGIGVLLSSAPGAITKIAFPITRAFKQIDHGEEYSIFSYFMAIPEFFSSQPKA